MGIKNLFTIYVPLADIVEIYDNSLAEPSLIAKKLSIAPDLQRKLEEFQHYYNLKRAHHGIDGKTPSHCANEQQISSISINRFQWKRHCRGLFQLPIKA
jgi:putative transposase